MFGKKWRRELWLVLAFILVVIIVALNPLATRQVRGKSSALPLSAEMSPAQRLAQSLALADSRVQAATAGRRAEVFGVRAVGQHAPADAARCATAACWQVEIYNFTDNAAVTAIVDVDSQTVLDVLTLPGMHPGLNRRLSDRALEIALNAPQVIDQLGFRPARADMAPVDAGLAGSLCDQGHLCVAPTFELGDRVLWAVVDLSADTLAGIAWTEMQPNPPGVSTPFVPEGDCPSPGGVGRGGWVVPFQVTGTDGLRVHSVTYNGVPVLTSVKLVEWHADYGTSGYEDSTGCGGGGGGFPIYPYGLTRVSNLTDEGGNVVGFELVQDFRMGNWGAYCNYRYEQHMQFFLDGRFRVVSGAYGKGCGTNAIYRPIVRLDIAVAGDDNDSFAYWDGSQWVMAPTETWWLQSPPYTPENYKWRVTDQSGAGFYLEPGVGQFDPPSDPDNAYMYITQHHPNEGDTDLGIIGDCCGDNEQQGPHLFLNGESVVNQNLVIWYVAQMVTRATPGDYYCWTVAGEPNPETYPCFSGPLLHPTQLAAAADFDDNGPIELGETAVFTNTSSGAPPLTYVWDFGDGVGSSSATHPTYIYASDGDYTVTLTTTNAFGSAAHAAVFSVQSSPQAGFTHNSPVDLGQPMVFTNTSSGGEPLTYAWDFGDGVGISAETNPTYTYSIEGIYSVTLSAANRYGTSTVSANVEVRYPPQAAFTHNGPIRLGDMAQFTNQSVGGQPLSFVWDFGDGQTSSEASPAHAYAQHGRYQVTLTASNPYGAATATDWLEVRYPPTADFNVVTEALVGQAVVFTNATVGAEPLTYAWDFGDGTTSAEANPTHVYAAADNYRVRLTATNEYDSSSLEKTITVRPYYRFLPLLLRP